jgi:primosomal protein N' (replication factor Y)
MVKPPAKLRLRREVAAQPIAKPEGFFTEAQVWVDASVYHLDTPFSYAIPGNLSKSIYIGSIVSVPFHGREILGVVISLGSSTTSGLKSISKVVGSVPLLSEHIIELIKSAAARYAAHPFDIIRSAIPDRVAGVEKDLLYQPPQVQIQTGKAIQQFLQLPPSKSRSELMAQKIKELRKDGGVLVILPDSGEVRNLYDELRLLSITPAVIDSQLLKSELYRNFLNTRLGKIDVVIGTRSAVFAPVVNLRSIVLYNEGSEHLYERRAPGWNARDIALLRRHNESLNIFFVGYSPSSEVARFIDEKWVEFKKVKATIKVSTIPQTHGELLPSRALSLVKKSLKDGPVLFVVPTKGYAQAIRCAKCRTISRCECGGAHIKASQTSPITCSHCSQQDPQWQCIWCNHPVPSLQSRGIDRHSHELGLLLPGVALHSSSSEHRVDGYISRGVVIATPGMAPLAEKGYAAVVILEGNRFLDQSDMRAGERVRELFFSHAALGRLGAPIILIQDEGHSIATALTTWNPMISMQRDLEERHSLGLPPYVRIAHLTMDVSEIARLKSALTAAREDGRLPSTVKILGPIPSGERASLILSVDVTEGDSLIATVHEFMRRRSAAKKSLPALRIDPYSLSR